MHGFRFNGHHFQHEYSFLFKTFRVFLLIHLNFIHICTFDIISNLDLNENSKFSKPRKLFTNEFVVYFSSDDANSDLLADTLALKYGFLNKGRILDENIYVFELPRRQKRSTRPLKFFDNILRRLKREKAVKEVDQVVAKRRVKRDFKKSDLSPIPKCSLSQCKNSTIIQNLYPNDPEWKNMWYLSDQFNHNVKETWALGITGKDVVVTIMDDGLEISHPDIKQNYFYIYKDPRASYDVNDNDDDPTPRNSGPADNRHGTRCAGEVAAVYNNSMCIVGVAYGARIGGIRMLDGDVTDVTEASSLSHNRQHVDIYSASWGPDDDGRSLDGPARLASLAFKQGVEQGRGGLGSIFVWASGNGGVHMDNCNCDGYTNSIYTLSISSSTERGLVPWFSEACSSTMATTYSSGGGPGESRIVTIDVNHDCTYAHTGTSASAPLAAGICALALEANRNLTWRDMQHLVVRTAQRRTLYASDWRVNGVGREFSHSFGYGLMDAAAMVKLARKWTGSGQQKTCKMTGRTFISIREMSSVEEIMNVSQSDHCWSTDQSSFNVFYLEHVQARLTLNTTGKRGDLQIWLTSPTGTKSTLLSKRANDFERKGFRDWPFMTVHMWGEKVFGEWKLEIQNDARDEATLIRWDLIFYGTTEEIGPTGLIIRNDDQILNSADQSVKCCGYSPLNLCIACTPDHILFQGKCVSQCPAQYQATNTSECETTCTPCPGYCSTCSDVPCASKLCVDGFEYDEKLKLCRKSNLRNIKDPVRRLFNHYNNLFKNHKIANVKSNPLWNSFSMGIICVVVLMVVASIFVVIKFSKRNMANVRENGQQEVAAAAMRPAKKNRFGILWRNWIIRKPATARTEFAMQNMPNSLDVNC